MWSFGCASPGLTPRGDAAARAGSQGVVYEGVFQGAIVAVKYSLVEACAGTELLLSRLMAHPNVVQTYSAKVAVLDAHVSAAALPPSPPSGALRNKEHGAPGTHTCCVPLRTPTHRVGLHELCRPQQDAVHVEQGAVELLLLEPFDAAGQRVRGAAPGRGAG